MSYLYNGSFMVIAFLIVISVVVFVHELGHYFVARLFSIKASVFSLGFGKVLLSRTDARGTKWCLSLIPFGGYVKFLGDQDPSSSTYADPKSMTKEERKYGFASKPIFARFLVAAAGPVANFLLGIAILALLFAVYGRVVVSNEVTSVERGGPADKAGIMVGDKIVRVNNENVSTFNEISSYVMLYPDIQMQFTIQRGGHVFTKNITPHLEYVDHAGKKIAVGKIGLGSSKAEYKKYGVFSAIKEAIKDTYNICSVTVKATGQIFSGHRGTKDLSGPIGIAKFAGDSLKHGSLIVFIAIISINLGLFNLFPMPPLDGGHLLSCVIESVFGRKINSYVQKYLIRVGIVLMIFLIVFALLNDIVYF